MCPGVVSGADFGQGCDGSILIDSGPGRMPRDMHLDTKGLDGSM